MEEDVIIETESEDKTLYRQMVLRLPKMKPIYIGKHVEERLVERGIDESYIDAFIQSAFEHGLYQIDRNKGQIRIKYSGYIVIVQIEKQRLYVITAYIG